MSNDVKTILIIEDDDIFSSQLKSWLDNGKYDVKVSNTAENGSYFISTQKPDIVFLDNQLPKLKGVEVVGMFKEFSPQSTIILMSGQFQLEDVAEAIGDKADYIINKSELTKERALKIVKAVNKSKSDKESLWNLLEKVLPNKKSSITGDIVIVDDDELFTFNLKWILSNSRLKNKIITFSELDGLFAYFKKNEPYLLFLDYHLHNKTGKDVLDFIKNKNIKTQVVIISGQENPETAIELSNYEILDYIVKNEQWKDKVRDVIQSI